MYESPLCKLFLSFSLGQDTPFSILCFLAFYVSVAIHPQAFLRSMILSRTWPLHASWWFAAYLQAIVCPGFPPPPPPIALSPCFLACGSCMFSPMMLYSLLTQIQKQWDQVSIDWNVQKSDPK